MRSVRFTPAARTDLAEITTYIEERSPKAALHVAARLKASFELLADNPGLGRRTTHPELRRLSVSALPYLVFYRVERDAIVIVAVRHGRRSPGSMPAL